MKTLKFKEFEKIAKKTEEDHVCLERLIVYPDG